MVKNVSNHTYLIASTFGLPLVYKYMLDPIKIKQVVRNFHDREVWRDCFHSPLCHVRETLKVRDKRYKSWDKSTSKALLFWRTGTLKHWKIYNLKNSVGINCPMPMCPGPFDDWNHLRDCQFYDTKWDNSWKLESEIAAYLVKVSRERYIKVKRPLF